MRTVIDELIWLRSRIGEPVPWLTDWWEDAGRERNLRGRALDFLSASLPPHKDRKNSTGTYTGYIEHQTVEKQAEIIDAAIYMAQRDTL